MSVPAYKRTFKRQPQGKIFSNSNFILNLNKNDITKKIEYQRIRLTGDKQNTGKLKSKNIMHSNSTNNLYKNNSQIIPSIIDQNKDRGFNNININVNNFIFNNNYQEKDNNSILIGDNNNNSNNNSITNINQNNNNSNNGSSVFTKLGSDIIGKPNAKQNYSLKFAQNGNAREANLKNVSQLGLKKKIYKLGQGHSQVLGGSNIQGVLDDLTKSTKLPYPNVLDKENASDCINVQLSQEKRSPISLKNRVKNGNSNSNSNLNKSNDLSDGNDLNISINKSNTNILDLDKEKKGVFSLDIEENILEVHFKIWDNLLAMEIHVENKMGITNLVKKMFVILEEEIYKNKMQMDIFRMAGYNLTYLKIIKITIILLVYIKFLLIDFNYEMTIKSNVKRLLSNINEYFLSFLCNCVFIKDNLKENIGCSKLTKEFIDNYHKLIKTKKIKHSKEQASVISANIYKNLEVAISTIKQFSNNFFKIGYFKPIHTICFDLFRLIDNYQVNSIAKIVVEYVFFYIIKKSQNDKKQMVNKIINFGGLNQMSNFGFINMSTPFLPELNTDANNKDSNNKTNYIYTLVLDLDETLVHFFYTPSGGTFLLRPYCLEFLERMSVFYELVIFTAATKEYADSILDLIDPDKKYIKHRLYRHHTSIFGITYVKDLSKIGRDLSKTIIIDNLADNFKLQLNNGIQCGTWIDDMKDKQLEDLSNILEQIVVNKVADVRNVVKKLREEGNKKLRKNMNVNPFKDIDISKLLT